MMHILICESDIVFCNSFIMECLTANVHDITCILHHIHLQVVGSLFFRYCLAYFYLANIGNVNRKRNVV